MAKNIKIGAGWAAPVCAVALLAALGETMPAAPAQAQDSLFSNPVEAPAVQSAAPATAPAANPTVKPKPKPKKTARKPAPKLEKPAEAPPAALPPVVVEAPAPEPQKNGFYDQMPKQFLLNKMFSPASLGQKDPNQPAQPGPAGAPPPPADDETQPNGMPRKYLLNRLFDSSALEPSRQAPSRQQPDPRSFMAQAQPPAQPAQPSWFEQATGALGLGAKPQDQTTTLPPVNVTAPANPAPRAAPGKPVTPTPAPVAVAPPPSKSWLDNIGLGGGANEPIPDYHERPKLVVPPNRAALAPPHPVEETKVQPPPSQEALTKPPASLTEKVQGPDGKVSGMTEQDEGKKGWFNWF